MGSIQRIDRPKPWRARYRGPDGRQISRSFRRKVDAEKWLLAEESAAMRGEWIDPSGGSVVFADWSESWLAGLHELKPKTLDGYRWHLKARVLPSFRDKRLRQITPAMVREWQTGLLDQGLSTGTVRQSRQVLNLILGLAVDDGLLVRNPVSKVKAPTVRPRRQRFLTAFELGRLSDECGYYGPFVWFLGWSGLRLGEAVALRVGRVNPNRRRVRVEESATESDGGLVWGVPKTHEARTVIVPRLVMERIKPLLAGKTPEDLVFAAPRGGPIRANNFRRRHFIPAAERIGYPDLVVHDLRDTAASLAISTGASIKAVQRMLGHSSAAMTLDIYGSLFEEDLEALADRLDERYG
jgi:integrase